MNTYHLMPGALTIDLVDGSIHGDLDHCPKEDLLESARALLSLLPQVRHKGLWGLGKAYDADCYLHTTYSQYKPPEDLTLPTMGPLRPDGERYAGRKFSFILLKGSRAEHWRWRTYFKLIGSVREGQVSEDITRLTSHYDAERWERLAANMAASAKRTAAKQASRAGGPQAAPEETHEMRPRMF